MQATAPLTLALALWLPECHVIKACRKASFGALLHGLDWPGTFRAVCTPPMQDAALQSCRGLRDCMAAAATEPALAASAPAGAALFRGATVMQAR